MFLPSLPCNGFFFGKRDLSRKARGRVGRSRASELRRARMHGEASVEVLEPRTLLSALVTTDQQAYAPGATVNITGSGFQASEMVDLRVVNETTNVIYTAWTGTDDTSGNFTSTWTAPSDAAGDTLQLTATGETSGSTAAATFTDGSTLTTDQTSYGPGATAIISGAGFLAGETVDLQVVRSDGTTYAPWSVTDGSVGTFTTNWTVPSDAPGYSFQITATGQSSGSSASASFNAPTTWVETIPTDYSPGQTAYIYAGGFQVGETVDFQVTNETDGNVYPAWSVTDASSSIQTGWVVPSDAANSTLELMATGKASGLTAETTFKDSLAVAATISPTTASVGQNQMYTFDLSVTNSSAKVSSAKVQVPSISNDPTNITITSPTGWTATLNTSTNPHEIDLNTSTNPITHNGTYLVFTFSAVANAAGTETWTTTAVNIRLTHT